MARPFPGGDRGLSIILLIGGLFVAIAGAANLGIEYRHAAQPRIAATVEAPRRVLPSRWLNGRSGIVARLHFPIVSHGHAVACIVDAVRIGGLDEDITDGSRIDVVAGAHGCDDPFVPRLLPPDATSWIMIVVGAAAVLVAAALSRGRTGA
ncbi:MAG: hypothetical protein KGM17_12425 [Sphingomonadales bacterium]|nr:hypothetical protein [Sphingomonadales bacterium]